MKNLSKEKIITKNTYQTNRSTRSSQRIKYEMTIIHMNHHPFALTVSPIFYYNYQTILVLVKILRSVCTYFWSLRIFLFVLCIINDENTYIIMRNYFAASLSIYFWLNYFVFHSPTSVSWNILSTLYFSSW